MAKTRFLIEVFGKIVLASGLLALSPGISRADVDCNSIVACTIPHPEGYYQPGFQANITGSFRVAADIFLDATCQNLFDTPTAEAGPYFGVVTFEYGLDPPMMSGDVVSWKVRFDGCPETDCLTEVAGTDVCQE
jgi:hypothetical protein